MTVGAYKSSVIVGKTPGEAQASPSTVRHDLATRSLHWFNALLTTIALMTGLQILNAHPRLYWGQSGPALERAVLEIYSLNREDGSAAGRLRLGDHVLATTGVLGISDGGAASRAFPKWATIPGREDLAAGRRWHFMAAWLLVFNSGIYLVATAKSGRLRRDILPIPDDLNTRVKYNPLQKLAYSVVIFVLGPLLLATGLAMSPALDAAWPWLPDLLGGRQSARTLHFGAAMAVAAFILIHVIMVLVTHPIQQIRAMITGRLTSVSLR